MESLAAPVTAALVLLIPVTLAIAIAKLAGNRDGVTLAEFMAPLATGIRGDERPRRVAVPEPEPVAWRFDGARAGVPGDRPGLGVLDGMPALQRRASAQLRSQNLEA